MKGQFSCQLTNQPVNQPTNPPTHQPTNPPTHQPTHPPTNQPTNQPTKQPTTNQRTNKTTILDKTFFHMKRNARVITITDLKFYYRAIVIKTQHWHKTDRLFNGIVLKTQTENHTSTDTQFFGKEA